MKRRETDADLESREPSLRSGQEEARGATISIGEPNFYRLGFGSQMIVWAMRRRLHLLARGASEANVVEVFGRAGLQDMHEALMSIVNLLLCRPSRRLPLHDVACAGLLPHEVSLLNAFAYRQRRNLLESERHLRELFCTTAAELLQPAVVAVVDGLNAGGLWLTVVGQDGDLAPQGQGGAQLH